MTREHRRVRVHHWALLVLVATAAACGSGSDGSSEPTGSGDPADLTSWHQGDVHAHAVGDTSLQRHPLCRDAGLFDETSDVRTDEELRACASMLVTGLAAEARRAGLEWVIVVEHGPWLGLATEGAPAGIPLYSADVGRTGWRHVRDAADELSAGGGVLLLMGEELGSSPPITTSGHLSVYATADFIDDGPLVTDEEEFLARARDAGAWGAINHPVTRGYSWSCYTPFDCDESALDHPEEVRAIEVLTGTHELDADAVAAWEQLLRWGLRVAAVGGSDTHTVARDLLAGGTAEVQEVLVWAGTGWARTFVFLPDRAAPFSGSDSTDTADAVRDAIFHGRTIASDGPALAVALDGREPSDTVVDLDEDGASLQVRWSASSEYTLVGVRVVAGEIVGADRCTSAACDEDECLLEGCVRTFELSGADPGSGELRATIDPVALYGREIGTDCRVAPPLFLRVEATFGRAGDTRAYHALTSPFYLPEQSVGCD